MSSSRKFRVSSDAASTSGSTMSRARRGHRGRRAKAGGGKTRNTLSSEDVEYLKKNTKYDENEIREWYKGFKSDCPDGTLGKSKILDMYSMILPAGNAAVFVDQIFRIFDKDGNGSIDFKEFMMATDMTASGSPEEKLRWAFKMYDKDGSGSIDLGEMVEIIGTLYEMEGVSKDSPIAKAKSSEEEAKEEEGSKEGTAADRAKRIFSELDVDGDGELTADEFVKGCMEDPELVRLLNAGGIVDSEDEEEEAAAAAPPDEDSSRNALQASEG